jgi:hypothetical protein
VYYLCKAPSTGNAPPNGTYWTVLTGAGGTYANGTAITGTTQVGSQQTTKLSGASGSNSYGYLARIPALTPGALYIFDIQYLTSAGGDTLQFLASDFYITEENTGPGSP